VTRDGYCSLPRII